MVTAGIKSVLQDIAYVHVIGSCADSQSAREFFRKQPADIVLLDINLPDISGLDLCLEFTQAASAIANTGP
ncbi:response regulator [uncultured Chitinophaga sp.]|uniref:response regulator n=1 Tax=uncultured Chitinophaga sp. TaxID=339340 RepID=UPI002607E0EC|nr:response regulator [uncultured Chitinophaga sp.]